MKHILESEETFEAYAVIDCCYYLLGEIRKELSKPKSSVDIMIDKATGFGEAKTKEWKEDSISLLKQIIKLKKKINADFKNDSKSLAEIMAING